MADNDEQKLTGEYLYTEWQGANKATGIGKRAWVRKMYPSLTYDQWWGRVYRSQQAAKGKVAPKPELYPFFIETEQVFEGDWMIVSDVHAPCTDYDMAQMVSVIAEKHLPKCQGLIVAGDMLNADAYSKYANLIRLPSWQTEIESAKHLFTEWLEMFPRIVWLMGNHEHRKLSADGGQTTVQQLLDMVYQDERITISTLDRCFINTDNGKWLIAHGSRYSQNQLVKAGGYANKYHCHVISGHEHHLAVGQDLFKRYIVVNTGGLFDPKKLAYVQLNTSDSPEMAPGFTMLKGGYPYVFGRDHVTDWQYWLGEEDTQAKPELKLVETRRAAV